MTARALAFCAVTAAALSTASARPPGDAPARQPGAPMGGGVDAIPFSDNFDSYAAGSGIVGQGGWEFWDPNAPTTNANVSNAQAFSNPHSLLLTPGSDVVQTGSVNSGKWVLTAKTYLPSNPGGSGYIIGMNTFSPPVYNWSMTIQWNPATGYVENWDAKFEFAIIKFDQWVDFKAEIDLDADLFSVWYDGVKFITDRKWSTSNSPGGLKQLQAIDLYNDTATSFYIDDVSLKQESACYPDCDGNGQLNIDDFICFQLNFALQNPYADCDGNSVFNIDDFICFQLAFAIGC